MFHKPYIYLLLSSFVIWTVNYLINRSCERYNEKNVFQMDDSYSVFCMIYWGPLAFLSGVAGLIMGW